MLTTALILLAALAVDALLGEPRRAHPLVGFGWLVARLERLLNRGAVPVRRIAGIAGLLLLVVPPAALVWWLMAVLPAAVGWLFAGAVLYLALGARSLGEHAAAVRRALESGDLDGARQAVARMVSRDTADLPAPRVASATVESVLENGNDGVFGAMLWFIVAGAPGVVVYRLVNTLDAMWGYRTPGLAAFGWAAARLDDLLNWIPARLTVLTYALVSGHPLRALACAWRQGGHGASPNAGIVMAAGAGGLGVRLGGPGRYHGSLQWRPRFGIGEMPEPVMIHWSVRLIWHGALLWVVCALLVGWWLA